MSLELILVFGLSGIPSSESLQIALDNARIPIQVEAETDLRRQSGFVPLVYDGRKTGFYLSRVEYKDFTDDYPDAKLENFDARAALLFGFGGNFMECAAALHSASALVVAFGAKAFDTESGTYLSETELNEYAKECYTEAKKASKANSSPP